MEKIKNIIFDLGGIFIDIDFKKTEKAFADLGIVDFNRFFTQHTASPLFQDLETGKLTPEEFYDGFRRETDSALTNDQIKDAWNLLLGRFPTKQLIWLEEIGFRYKIYLFSNTNIIHYDAFQQIYRDCTGKDNFDDYFVKAYYSHDLGLRKPTPESFAKILALENLRADETLFIDDTPKNIEGAKQAGLHATLVASPMTILDLDL
jgi:putative hydrolase of the HAD superfamily